MISRLALACLVVTVVSAATVSYGDTVHTDLKAERPETWAGYSIPYGFNLFYDEEDCDKKWGHTCIIWPWASYYTLVHGCSVNHGPYESVTAFPHIDRLEIKAFARQGRPPHLEEFAVPLTTDAKCASVDVASISGAYLVDDSPRHKNPIEDGVYNQHWVDVEHEIWLFYAIDAKISGREARTPNHIYGTIVGDAAYFVVKGAKTRSFNTVDRLIKGGADDDQVQEAIVRHWDLRMRKKDEDKLVEDRKNFWEEEYDQRPSELEYTTTYRTR